MSDNGRDELEMMSKPDRWPHTFVLPVKRVSDGKQQHGFLFQGSMETPCPPPMPTVFLGNMFAISRDNPISDFPRKQYESLEAIVSDGWIVD